MNKKLTIFIIITINIINILSFRVLALSDSKIQGNQINEDRLQSIKNKGVLSVLCANDIPFCFIDSKTKEYTGIDVDIIKEAAKRLGIGKVEINSVIGEELIDDLYKKSDVDIIGGGIVISDERKKRILFTDPIYKESEGIVTHVFSKYVIKENLKDAIVGVQKGSVFLELAKTWLQKGEVKEIKTYNSQIDILNAVNKGEVDAGITDSISTFYIIRTNPNLYLKTIPQSVYKPELPGEIGLATRLGDTSLKKALNQKIFEMKQDHTILKILEKYGLNEEFYVPNNKKFIWEVSSCHIPDILI